MPWHHSTRIGLGLTTKPPMQERRKVLIFIKAINELPFDHQASDYAAQVRVDLVAAGVPSNK